MTFKTIICSAQEIVEFKEEQTVTGQVALGEKLLESIQEMIERIKGDEKNTAVRIELPIPQGIKSNTITALQEYIKEGFGWESELGNGLVDKKTFRLFAPGH
jgi:5,10-methylene-tetrahydrofolate dehydrogenase/methenyl tetrahydrofolate cyclohydrolase